MNITILIMSVDSELGATGSSAFLNQIQYRLVKSTCNRRACVVKIMRTKEAKEISQNHTKWRYYRFGKIYKIYKQSQV